MTPNRDPAFWRWVTQSPEVQSQPLMGGDISTLLQNQFVTPLASANGGYLFGRMDGLGRVFELHAMFRREGWGREALTTLKAALVHIDADVILATEIDGNWRSRPPKSFGFTTAADFAPTPYGPQARTWILTRERWTASPAYRRHQCLKSS